MTSRTSTPAAKAPAAKKSADENFAVVPDGFEAADDAVQLTVYSAMRARAAELTKTRNAEREDTSALGKEAVRVLAALSPEDQATVRAWVRERDLLAQAQGGLNLLKEFAHLVHNMESAFTRERRRRTEITRIKTQLEQLLGIRRSRPKKGKEARGSSSAPEDFSTREYPARTLR